MLGRTDRLLPRVCTPFYRCFYERVVYKPFLEDNRRPQLELDSCVLQAGATTFRPWKFWNRETSRNRHRRNIFRIWGGPNFPLLSLSLAHWQRKENRHRGEFWVFFFSRFRYHRTFSPRRLFFRTETEQRRRIFTGHNFLRGTTAPSVR